MEPQDLDFATHYKRTVRESDYETPVGQSLTVPDMSLSVQEILTRFTRGTLSPEEIARNYLYDSDLRIVDLDSDLDPDFDDLTDIDLMRERYNDKLANIMEEIKYENYQKKLAEQRKELEKDKDSSSPLPAPSA